MIKRIFIVIAIFLFVGCLYKNPENPFQKKIPDIEANTDFNLFVNILNKVHPSLFLYTSRNRFSTIVDSIKSTIKDNITIADFFNKLNFVINEIGCSHTSVELSSPMFDSIKKRNYFFPYPVKLVEGKLLVNVSGYSLNAGDEIKNINGQLVNKIIHDLTEYNPVDGIHRKTQETMAGENFALEYFYKYGAQNEFNIEYIDSLGVKKNVSEQSITLNEWDNRNFKNKYYYDRTDIDYDLSINDKRKIAVLRLPTFDFESTEKQDAFENFCYNGFELLENKKIIKTLIIDVRKNGGGKLFNAFFLFSFLTKINFKEYMQVSSKIKKVPFQDYLDADFVTNDLDDLNAKLKDEFTTIQKNGNYLLKDSLITKWKPDKFAYKRNIYVIIDAPVTSAASYFSVLVKNSGVGKIIGEETAGGENSSNGFSILKYSLPKSKINIFIPYAHIIYSFKDSLNFGQGVIPNYNLPDSYLSFKKNEDRQYYFIKDSITLR